MLAVTIAGVLASLAIPSYFDFLDKARTARAVSELHMLTMEIKGYALGGGEYPNTLNDIGRGALLDPWGSPYRYYRINCGPVDDITNLAKLRLQRNRTPRVVPALYSLPLSAHHDSSIAVDQAHDEEGHIFLIQGGAGGGGAGGGGPPCGGVGGARKDRFLVPINSDFDIYSTGKNRVTVPPLTPPQSRDDVIRASDGGYYGLAKNF